MKYVIDTVTNSIELNGANDRARVLAEPIGETIFQNMIQAPNFAQILLGGYFFGKIRWPP